MDFIQDLNIRFRSVILIEINCHILTFSKEFSLKSNSEFTFPFVVSKTLIIKILEFKYM